MKLNQVVALVKGKKTKAQNLLTEVHHGWKDALLSGRIRTYEPKDDEGTRYPDESQHVQRTVDSVLDGLLPELKDFFNVIATQELYNQNAVADIVVDGVTIYQSCPVTLLMFLEKQLTDLSTLIRELPTLPTEKKWTWDVDNQIFRSDQVKSFKMRKVYKTLTKAEATKEHPAQVEVYTEDLPEGTWTTVFLSGRITKERKQNLMNRVIKLRDAVKVAREKANDLDVTMEEIFGQRILDYLFKSEAAKTA